MNLNHLKHVVSWEWLNEKYLTENPYELNVTTRDAKYYEKFCDWISRNFKRLFKNKNDFDSFVLSIFYEAPIEHLYSSPLFKMPIAKAISKEFKNIHSDLSQMERLWTFWDVPDVVIDIYESEFNDTYMNPNYPDFMRFWESFSYTQHVSGKLFRKYMNEFMSNEKIIKNLFLHSKHSKKLIEELDLNTNRVLYNKIINIYKS